MLQLIPVTVGYTPQLSALQVDQHSQNPDLSNVLKQYAEVFEESQGLPPSRPQFDHKIPLKK